MAEKGHGAAAEAALAAVDWARIDAMTDTDIDRQIADNPDAVEPSADARVYRHHRPTGVSTRRIREGLSLTQAAFAKRFGFSVGAVRDWEQGRRDPDRATQHLLGVIRSAPELVAEIVERMGGPKAA